MRLRYSLLVFGLLVLGPAAYAATPACARVEAQPDAWVAARVDALVTAARAAFESDAARPAYERVLGDINTTLRRCRLAQDESFGARYRTFVEYVETAALDAQADHELGFVVPDRQYFAETHDYVQIPDFLLAQDFIRAASRTETLARAKAYLEQLNCQRAPEDQLIYFSYISRHLGTPDNDDSFKRLLVVVPGHTEQHVPEKWVQFGVTDAGARVRVRNVSVVATLPAPDGTSNVYFKDFYRTYKHDGAITIKGRWELGYGDDNCVQCHKSGILPIFPAAGSVRADEQPALAAVNERFLTYGSPRFDKYLDARKLGPGLGTAQADERERRFGASFGTTNVAHAMTCAACHKDARLGALNWPMDRTIISSFVKGGQMPLGYDLPLDARNALYARLIQEYFATDDAHPGVLKAWLLGRQQ